MAHANLAETLLRRKASEQTTALAESLAQLIEQNMERELRSVEGLASVMDARAVTLDPFSLRPIVDQFHKRYGETDMIMVARSDGRGVAWSRLAPEVAITKSINYSDRDYFKAMQKHRRSVISRVQIGRRTQRPNIHVVAPIGRPARGLVVLSLGLGTLWRPARRAVSRMVSARAIVWDWEHRIVLDTEIGDPREIRLVKPAGLFAPMDQVSVEPRRGVTPEGVMSEGAAARAIVGPRAWTVLVIQPRSAIYAESRMARLRALAVTFVVLLLTAITCLAISRWIAGPIADLAQAAERIDAGEYSATFHTDRRFRPLEAVHLAQSLSKMLGRLKNHAEELQSKVKERTTELETARNEALTASRHKSEFIANMSHEIRTPMNGVLGMIELLASSAENPEQREYAQTAHRSALGLLDLLNDILDFAKIESGKLTLEARPFDLDHEVYFVGEMFRTSSGAKGLELIVDIQLDVPRAVVGDASRIRQVLANLVGNAIKFTSQGFVRIDVSRADDVLRFAVTDTGIGVARERRERIFEDFAQADGSTTRRFGGTGLGLAISKRLVELMAGKIYVESELGKGSTFTFELELPTAESSNSKATLPQHRVLIIAPHGTVTTSLKGQLQRLGIEHTTTANVDWAQRAFAERPSKYTVALVDQSFLQALDPGRLNIPLIQWSRPPDKSAQLKRHPLTKAILIRPASPSSLLHLLGSAAPESSVTKATSTNAIEYSGKILAVDDNAINRKVIKRMLESFGLEVELGENGLEAVERVKSQDFHLVLMDCQMPDMDGYSATRAIRALGPGKASVPIVALTANAAEEDRRRCLEAGMNAHMAKPVTRRQIACVLRTWLGSSPGPVGEVEESRG